MGIQSIGLTHPAVLPGLPARRLSNGVSVAGHGTGEDCTKGSGPLDHPQRVSVGPCATSHPPDRTIDPSSSGGKRLSIDQLSYRAIHNCVNMMSSVSVDPDDKWMRMSNDRLWWSSHFLLVELCWCPLRVG